MMPTNADDYNPTQWLINPKIHDLFAERAEKERQRREHERRKMREAFCLLGLHAKEDDRESV